MSSEQPQKKEGPTMDTESCSERLKSFYEVWSDSKTSSFFNGSDGILLGSGANKEEELRYLKAVSLEIWLFSYELPDTVMAFIKKEERGEGGNEMHAIASGKKAKLLESARATIED